jgi:hypothetical protein
VDIGYSKPARLKALADANLIRWVGNSVKDPRAASELVI